MGAHQPVEQFETARFYDVIAEPAFNAPVLGWEGRLAVNSFAPLSHLTTTSTDEPRMPGWLGRSQIQVGTVREAESEALQLEDVLYPWLAFESRLSVATLYEVEPLLLQRSRDLVAKATRIVFSLSPRKSRIETTRETDVFAEAAGAREDVAVIGESCLRLLPGTKGVFVTVTHDPEDGTAGLHFRVRTSASIDAIIAAEDQLHQVLFERIPSARRPLFSIGYEFVR